MTIHRHEAEQRVIGGLLLDPSKFDEVADLVTHKDFFNGQYRSIFSAMGKVMEGGEFPEWQLVGDKLDQTNPGEEWFSILAALQKNTPSSENLHIYAAMVSEDARCRQLFLTAPQIQGMAQDRSLTMEQRVNQAHALIDLIQADRAAEGPVPVCEKLKGFVDHLDACAREGDGITGMRTGFKNIDSRLGGLKPGELTVIAARPSMGKTSFALNIATNVAIDQGLPVLFFTIEMDSNQIIGRMISNLGSIHYSSVLSARLTEWDWAAMSQSVGNLNNKPFVVDDSSSLHVQEIISRSRRQHRKSQLALIVVDHIGLVDADGENETVKVGRVSRGLKRLAKKIGVPVLALSQLNRGLEQRPNKRPVLSDLRHSGDIEQDADNVGFLYRDDYYREDSMQPGIAEVIWRKVRAGQVGTDYFKAQFNFHRFTESDQPVEIVEFSSQRSRKRRG